MTLEWFIILIGMLALPGLIAISMIEDHYRRIRFDCRHDVKGAIICMECLEREQKEMK